MTKAIATPAAFEMLASPARQEPETLLADRATEYDDARDRVIVAVRAMQRTAAARDLSEEALACLVP